jgi:hypothetical protein
MKKSLKYLLVSLGISVLIAIPSVNARMGGGFGSPGPSHFNGGHFDHDHFHGHSSFFFYGGFPIGYPYYGAPYYYYDYPYYYDRYYYAPQYYYDNGPTVSYNDRSTAYPSDDSRSYLMLGHDAGKSLGNKSVTWDWFVEYLQAYIVNAPQWVRDDFQRGFVSGYGSGADNAFAKGIQQAARRNVSTPENSTPATSAPNALRD